MLTSLAIMAVIILLLWFEKESLTRHDNWEKKLQEKLREKNT